MSLQSSLNALQSLAVLLLTVVRPGHPDISGAVVSHAVNLLLAQLACSQRFLNVSKSLLRYMCGVASFSFQTLLIPLQSICLTVLRPVRSHTPGAVGSCRYFPSQLAGVQRVGKSFRWREFDAVRNTKQ